jgi:hypothetical protein
VCASTPPSRPTKINQIDLTRGGCVGAPLSVSLATILDGGVAPGATLELNAQELNGFYTNYWLAMA